MIIPRRNSGTEFGLSPSKWRALSETKAPFPFFARSATLAFSSAIALGIQFDLVRLCPGDLDSCVHQSSHMKNKWRTFALVLVGIISAFVGLVVITGVQCCNSSADSAVHNTHRPKTIR